MYVVGFTLIIRTQIAYYTIDMLNTAYSVVNSVKLISYVNGCMSNKMKFRDVQIDLLGIGLLITCDKNVYKYSNLLPEIS